jgi:hypothetical protein
MMQPATDSFHCTDPGWAALPGAEEYMKRCFDFYTVLSNKVINVISECKF